MAKGRRSRGARSVPGSHDHSLDRNIGSSRPRGSTKRTVCLEECGGPDTLKAAVPNRGMESWPLSNIQRYILREARDEAIRKAEVSALLGKGTCITFYFGTQVRATPHKNAANSRWITKPVEGKDYLSQVVCPMSKSLRCAKCILNSLEDENQAQELRDVFPAEVEVAIGREYYSDGRFVE